MLLGGREAGLKQVAVKTRNQQFNKLLGSILAEWKFFTVDDLSAATVIFAERGIDLSGCETPVVWLTPMPLFEGTYLTVPISLNSLYHLLECKFFPTPRRHIRVAMELSVEVRVGKHWLEGKLLSLSDRGGRIVCCNEIPRGEMLSLEMVLAGQVLQLPAEVLYCIPAGDSPGRSQPQVGVLFKPASGREFSVLRHFVEKVCIESACAREDIHLSDPCLSWFDMVCE